MRTWRFWGLGLNMGVLTNERPVDADITESAEPLPVLARFPAMDPDRSLSDEPRPAVRAPAAPPLPNTRVLTFVVLGLLALICAAWLFWPSNTAAQPEYSGDVTAPYLRDRQPPEPMPGGAVPGAASQRDSAGPQTTDNGVGTADATSGQASGGKLKGFIYVSENEPAEESDDE